MNSNVPWWKKMIPAAAGMAAGAFGLPSQPATNIAQWAVNRKKRPVAPVQQPQPDHMGDLGAAAMPKPYSPYGEEEDPLYL